MEIMLMNETDPELIEMRAQYDERDDLMKSQVYDKKQKIKDKIKLDVDEKFEREVNQLRRR